MNSKFVRWWNNNPEKAEAIKERRKQRYHNDPEYREKVRQRNRDSYHKRKVAKKRYPKPRFWSFKGNLVELWSVGMVADYLGVHKRTLSNLESKGTIPTNRYVDINGRRWWPASYVKWLKQFFDARQNGELTYQQFTDQVWMHWYIEEQAGQIPVIGEDEHGGRDQTSSNEGAGYDDGQA